MTTTEEDFKSRESGKLKNKVNWHAYIYPKNLDKFEQPKLSSMEICSKLPNVTLNNEFYHPTTVYSWVKNDSVKESYEYFMSIANSKLLWWFLKLTGDTLQGDARRLKNQLLESFSFASSNKQRKRIGSGSAGQVCHEKQKAATRQLAFRR